MCRKLTLFMVVFIALQAVLAGNVFAADAWWSGSAGDHLWSTPGNWWPSGGAPVPDGNAHLDQTLPLFCTINPDTNVVTTLDAFVGDWAQINNMADPNMPILDVNNQIFNVTRNLYIALRETTFRAAGVQSVGDVNVINGGIINIGGDLWVGSEGIGDLHVRDGDVNIIGTLRCPGGPQPAYDGQRYISGTGRIELLGGTIEANDIYCQINDTTQINITGGTLILNGNKVSAITDLMTGDKLYAYDHDGDIECDYNVRNAGKTTVTGKSDPNLATSVSPKNYAKDVSLTAQLVWAAGINSPTHDVYFSTTSFSDVNDANHSTPSGIFKGNQVTADVNYNPGTLQAETVCYWRIDEIVGATTHKGNVWRFTTLNPYVASLPTPINYKANVPSSQALSWTKGIAATNHDIYLGTNLNDVTDANTSTSGTYRGRIASVGSTGSYSPTDLLLGNVQYYWRIDEVNTVTSTVWKGLIWRFTTNNYRLIDNFDIYGQAPSGTHPWITDAWKAAGGASISDETFFSDTTTATIDYNAMRITYNNSGAPYYSEANYLIPAGAKQDWSSGGVQILGMSIHGEAANQVEKLYVTVKDANNHSVTVAYPDSNGIVQRLDEYWSWWLIDLSKFSDGGVYLKDVHKLYIGLGDKVSPGGSGIFYVDNVALYPRWCPTGFNISFNQSGDADLNGDCAVNMDDLTIMVDSWLESSYQVTATAPPTPSTDPNLIVWYKFDDQSGNTAVNSSMYGATYNGSVPWDLWDATGYDGNGGLLCDGTQRVDVPIAAVADANLGGHSTVAFWIKEDAPLLIGTQLFQIGGSGTGNLQVWCAWPGDFAYTCGRYPETGWQDTLFWGRYGFTNPEYIVGQWNHFAFTKDHTTGVIRIYQNGETVAEYKGATAAVMSKLVSGTNFFTVAAYRYSDGAGGYYTGIMDDFRLYNRALSDEEILSLAGGSSITQPILSAANVVADSQVNFKDFAVVAGRWLEEPLLWP